MFESAYMEVVRGTVARGFSAMSKARCDDELEHGGPPDRLDTDHPRDRALLERLSAKLLRLDREALLLAAAMRQKPKPT